MPLLTLIDSNISVLQSATRILDRLSTEQFNLVLEPHFSASVGKHLRHILDHYICFLAGLEEASIDYDSRPRNNRIETDLDQAKALVTNIIAELDMLKSKQSTTIFERAVKVTLSTAIDQLPSTQVTSSIERELVFIHGHSTHHYALIAIMLKMLEFEVEPDLGVAPSTLSYNDSLRCAQ